MAIWYVDPVNGDNSKSGNSFANRRLSLATSGPNGSTAGTPFGTNLLADGDEVRIIKSPDFTSLGNGTWTAKPKGGGITDQVSNCTGVKGNSTTTINCPSAHGLTTGDPVYISTVNSAPSNLQGLYEATVTSTTQFTVSVNTSSDTWTDNSTTFTVYINLKYNCVKLTSSYTKEIAFCAGRSQQWISANANVNGGVGNKLFSTNSNFSCYNFAQNGARISVTNSSNQFGASGKAAYYQLPSTLDLSSYQQICFKAGYSHGLPNQEFINFISIKLCSDSNGDVVVHSIPVTRSGGDSNYNFEIVKDFGTNLSNNINSVALHIDANVVYDYDIYVDQIMACQASSSPTALTLNSVISKSNDNVNAVEHYTVSDIVGNFVFFGENHSYRTDKVTLSDLKYSGTSETVTTYHRPALSLLAAAHFGSYSHWIYFNSISSFSFPNGVTISGGWNETDMSTQTGHTVVDGMSSTDGIILFSFNNHRIVNISRISCSRTFHFIQNYDDSAVNLEKCTLYGGKYGNVNINGTGPNTFKDCFLIGGDPNFQDDKGDNTTYDNCTLIRQNNFSNSGAISSLLKGKGTLFKNCTMRDIRGNQSSNYNSSYYFLNCTFDDGSDSWYRFGNYNLYGGGKTIVKDCTWTNYTGNFIGFQSGAFNRFQNDISYLAFHNFNGAAGDHRIYFNNATMFSESTVRYVNSGLAWKISTLTTDYNASKPFSRVFIESFVSASTQVTASIWARRTNTGMTVQLGALKDENDFDIGLTSDVITSMTAAADTWEQISISFVPPKAGKCKIRVFVYGGSTYSAYVDAPTITQV